MEQVHSIDDTPTSVGSDEAQSPAEPVLDINAIENEVDEELARSVPERFCIDSPEAAAWLVRKIASARQYAVTVKSWAELEQHRALREEQRLLFLFGDQLRRWTRGELDRTGSRRRSISLPSGTAGFRSVPARLVIKDELLVMRWARRACPSAIAVAERLRKTPIIEHVHATGEIPEGAELTGPRTDFFVR